MGIEGEESAGDDEVHVDMLVKHCNDEVVEVVLGGVEAGSGRQSFDVLEDELELVIELVDGGRIALHDVSRQLEG